MMNETSRQLSPSRQTFSTAVRQYLFGCIAVFILLFILTFPHSFRFIPDTGTMLRPLTESVVRWVAVTVLSAPASFHSPILSDTVGLYILLCVIGILAAVLSGIWMQIRRRGFNVHTGIFWLGTIAAYYLGAQLFEYGFNKVFKWQFFLPEPNTLFTTLGNIPRDLLYWSTMGTSRSWTMFAGITEVLAGTMLLFRRTRTAGALLAMGIMINVFVVNVTFDISVKVFSSFLLLVSILVLAPDIPNLLRFFFGNRQGCSKGWAQVRPGRQHRKLYSGIKALVVATLLFDVLTPYVRSGNFNDDRAPRPYLHGAYQVRDFLYNGDTLAPLLTLHSRWKRVFVHRRGYLVIERMDGTMLDYTMRLQRSANRLDIQSPRTNQRWSLRYSARDSVLSGLEGKIGKDSIAVTLKAITLGELPLLQDEFHWAIDENQLSPHQERSPAK